MKKYSLSAIQPFCLCALVLMFAFGAPAGNRNAALAKNVDASTGFYQRMIDGLDGKKRNLASWRGKVIIANFWASWCGPCQYEIPRFINWQHKYADKGLQVVGIGLDEAQKLKNVARSLEIDYPLLFMSLDEGRPILDAFGDDKMIIPFTVIFNRDGTVAARHKGVMGEDEFEILIAPLLQ